MKDTKETHWIVTWKSPGQRDRKEIVFGDSSQAWRWYDEKSSECRKPRIFLREQTSTYTLLM
jgi:hypothetical protein